MSITVRLQSALKECDRAKNFRTLQSLFKQHVMPICHQAVHVPLTQALSHSVSPAVCCPAAAEIRSALTSLERNDDVWYLLLQNAPSLLKTKRQRNGESLDEDVAISAFVIFYGRGLPPADEMKCRWKFLVAERELFEKSSEFLNSNASERRKLHLDTVLSVFSEKAHRHAFSAFWTKFLTVGSPPALHLHLLNRLPVDIMPHLTNPIVVADYLSACFCSGGLVAVLALKGLFLLMLDHGLEQPKFYEQLYSLLTPDAFSSRHRYELFELVDLCLKSLRVPSYIAAAFAKRTIQIALLSPAPTMYFSLPFLRQLFQRHPNCLSLIHRTASSLQADALESESNAEVSKDERERAHRLLAELFAGKDPFDVEERNPWKSDAINSSLWELTLLEKHFLPAVPLMVSAFASTAEDTTPLRFEKTYGRLFAAEVTREISSSRLPAVAYAAPEYDSTSSANVVIV